jgi:hypothetical protein
MNKQLHSERIEPGTHRRRLHPTPWADLPDGTYVRVDGSSAVIIGDQLAGWTHEGYQRRRARPNRGLAQVIIPPSSVAALRAGYPVQIDPSA